MLTAQNEPCRPALKDRRFVGLLIAIALFSGYCLFFNLGQRPMWVDEAETALLGINITKFGVPKANDGKNYVAVMGKGVDTNANDVWTWAPWLDKYITAGSIALFGKTNFAARLPFAVIGLLSVFLLAFVTQRIYRDFQMTLVTVLLYATCAAVILHIRQCRYYAILLFAQMLVIYGYYLLNEGRSRPGIPLLTLGLLLIFYCNFPLVAPLFAAMGITALLFHRWRWRLIADQAVCVLIFSLLVIPWILYAKTYNQSTHSAPGDFPIRFARYVVRMHYSVVPLIILAIPVVIRIFKGGWGNAVPVSASIRNTHVFMLTAIPIHLAVISLMPGPFFRYMLPLIPSLFIIASWIVVYTIRNARLRWAVVALLAFTNVISFAVEYPFRLIKKTDVNTHTLDLPIVTTIRDISSPYRDSLGDIVEFLNKNARPNEVLISPDYEFPIMFYTGLRVIDTHLPPLLPPPAGPPDWIFARSASAPSERGEALKPDPKNAARYETIDLDVHASPRGDCRPDPGVHVNFTVDQRTKFRIYKLVR